MDNKDSEAYARYYDPELEPAPYIKKPRKKLTEDEQRIRDGWWKNDKGEWVTKCAFCGVVGTEDEDCCKPRIPF